MKNNSVKQADGFTRTMNSKLKTVSPLSDNALYLMTLASQLKKLLGPVSLKHFLATGETVKFIKKASLS